MAAVTQNDILIGTAAGCYNEGDRQHFDAIDQGVAAKPNGGDIIGREQPRKLSAVS